MGDGMEGVIDLTIKENWEAELNRIAQIQKKKQIPISQIVEKYLRDNGFDGLCNGDFECGCGLNSLCACEYPDWVNCIPGYKMFDDDSDSESYGETIIVKEKPEA